MNKVALAFALAALTVGSAWAETTVGVSVGINEPGFYGRIEVGNRPPPPVVYTQPVVIVASPVAVHQRPIYMHVPPGHQKNWAKHCSRYNACGQPVYFVRDEWAQQHASSHAGHDVQRGNHTNEHGKGGGHGPGKGHGKGRGKD